MRKEVGHVARRGRAGSTEHELNKKGGRMVEAPNPISR